MATTTISALTAVTAPNLTDVSVFEVEDVNTNSRKVSITQLRVQINTGAQVFTAGATFAGAVSGITTLAGTGAVSGFTTADFSGNVTITKASGNSFKFILAQTGVVTWNLTNIATTGLFQIDDGVTAAFTIAKTTYAANFAASVTVASGLTVSAGTTAVQALTATTMTTSLGLVTASNSQSVTTTAVVYTVPAEGGSWLVTAWTGGSSAAASAIVTLAGAGGATAFLAMNQNNGGGLTITIAGTNSRDITVNQTGTNTIHWSVTRLSASF